MNGKMRSSVMGLILGQFSSPLPEVQKEPVAYLYNGVRLPKLPEWDKETYPYAYILDAESVYYLSLRDSQKTVITGGNVVDYSDKHQAVNGEWVLSDESQNVGKVIWANYDVYYSDSAEEVGGTLYLAASDPIPAYE